MKRCLGSPPTLVATRDKQKQKQASTFPSNSVARKKTAACDTYTQWLYNAVRPMKKSLRDTDIPNKWKRPSRVCLQRGGSNNKLVLIQKDNQTAFLPRRSICLHECVGAGAARSR